MSQSKYNNSSPLAVSAARLVASVIGKVIYRTRYHGTSNIRDGEGKGLIIASNHPSYLDPFLISIPIKRDLRFMTWDEAFDWPLAGPPLRALGAFPVNIEGRAKLGTLRASISLLRKKKALVIFPEGEREFENGELLEFKSGAARLALETGCPILPVTIVGANRVWSRDHTFPRIGKVEVIYHPLLRLSKAGRRAAKSEIDQGTELLRKTIESGLRIGESPG